MNSVSSKIICKPLFKNGDRYSLEKIVKYLYDKWKIKVEEVVGDDDSAVLKLMGESISIGYIPSEIPKHKYEELAKHSYLWKDCSKEIQKHSSHAIVSFLPSDSFEIKKCKIMSAFLEALFATSDAIGVYKSEQSLLISSDVYIGLVKVMAKDSDLPVLLWVYMAWIKQNKKTSMYTCGMHTFGKKEVEIWESNHEPSDVHNLIINLCSYIIENNIDFKGGETLGESEEDLVHIKVGKSRFIDDKTVQVDF